MANATEMFRQGLISERSARKIGVLKGTRAQGAHMEPFDNKAGRTDQGGVRDRGVPAAGRSAIDKNQREGSPIAGRPSRGGRVNRTGQPRVDHIDREQGPAFPKGASAKRGNGKGLGARTRGRIVDSGPEYGGPNSRADG
jgi:hypothetical protein